METSAAAKGCKDVLVLGGQGDLDTTGRPKRPKIRHDTTQKRIRLIALCVGVVLKLLQLALEVKHRGVSAVAAVRAMEAHGKVVIWEPLEDVAHAAREVWGARGWRIFMTFLSLVPGSDMEVS